jgi:hypothetical protein
MKPVKLVLITTLVGFSLALAGAASAAGTPAQQPAGEGKNQPVEELALVNSQEKAKVLAVASFRAPGAARFPTVFRGASWVRRWLGEHWREARFRAVSGTSVVAI